MNSAKIILACVAAAGITGCATKQEHLKSLNKDYVCDSIAPGADFYDYVTKGWQLAIP